MVGPIGWEGESHRPRQAFYGRVMSDWPLWDVGGEHCAIVNEPDDLARTVSWRRWGRSMLDGEAIEFTDALGMSDEHQDVHVTWTSDADIEPPDHLEALWHR